MKYILGVVISLIFIGCMSAFYSVDESLRQKITVTTIDGKQSRIFVRDCDLSTIQGYQIPDSIQYQTDTFQDWMSKDLIIVSIQKTQIKSVVDSRGHDLTSIYLGDQDARINTLAFARMAEVQTNLYNVMVCAVGFSAAAIIAGIIIASGK